METIKLQDVNSTYLSKLFYQKEEKKLYIQFKSDEPEPIYAYFDVPFEEYKEMMKSPSLGRYFIQNIQYRYAFKRVDLN